MTNNSIPDFILGASGDLVPSDGGAPISYQEHLMKSPEYLAILNSDFEERNNPMTEAVAQKKHPMTMGIADVSDWIIQGFLFDMMNANVNSMCAESSWTFSRRSEVDNWVDREFAGHRRLASSSRSTYIWFGTDCLIDIYVSATLMTINMFGNPERIEEVNRKLANSPFTSSKCTVTWIHSTDGSSVTVPLRKRPLIESAYPWVKQGVKNYIQEFLDSDEAVLILIGPPGTGKTSFIRNMILQADASAMVSYNPEIMGSDSLFATWIDSRNQFIVLEDSDRFLSARTDGNEMMHKFLNVSEGLITVPGKKMIFSTNLPKISDIDSALMRKGRCFDVLSFRHLVGDEIEDVLTEVGSNRDYDPNRAYSLAELFTKSDEDAVVSTPKTAFGFAGGA